MKRVLEKVLAMALCLCLMATAAVAQEGTASSDEIILPEDPSGSRMVRRIAAAEDTVYILTTMGPQAELWHWREGMQQAKVYPDAMLYAPYYGSTEDAQQGVQSVFGAESVDVKHAITTIFAMEDKLYAYNGLEQLVFEIEDSGEGLRYHDLITIEWPGANPYQGPISIMKVQERLIWLETDQNSRRYTPRMLVFDMETGAVKQAVLPELVSISSYKDNKVLALCKNEDTGYSLYSYDPVTDVTQRLGELKGTGTLRAIGYSDALDRIVYQDKTRIMGWTPEQGGRQVGFIPQASYVQYELQGDYLIWRDQYEYPERLKLSALNPEFDTENGLVILCESGILPSRAFHSLYPEVPFYYLPNAGMTVFTYEDYQEIFAAEAPDLMYLYGNNPSYQQLVSNGNLLDLSVYPDIREYIERLYPVYRELAGENGAIYGVPVYADAYNGWFINKEVMNALGLTPEEIPTSLTEMCAFATRWNDEFAEQYPNYTLINNTTSYRLRLLEAILSAWSGYCQYNGKALDFDDPLLCEALCALEEARLDKLDAMLRQTNPEVSEYKQALIWTGIKTIGNWATYMEDYSDRIFMPMTLTENTPYTVGVESTSLWAVNADTKNAEYAAAMIGEFLKTLDPKRAYALCEDLTEPVENPYYAEMLADEEEYLASLEAKLAESVNKAAAEKRIADQKAYIAAELDGSRYEITPSAIENYRNVIVKGAYIVSPNQLYRGLRNNDVVEIIDQYVQGQLTMEQFLVDMKLAIGQ